MQDLKYIGFPSLLPAVEEKSKQLQFGMSSER